jgi:alpha-mannosidase
MAGEITAAELMNEGKQNIAVFSDQGIMLPLLRTPPFVEQGGWVIHKQPRDVPRFNDLGYFDFRFALAVHEGDWRSFDLPRRGMEFNTPLMCRTVRSQAGKLPPAASGTSVFASLDGTLQVAFDCIFCYSFRLFKGISKGAYL